MSRKVQTLFEVSIICIKLLPKFPSKLLFGLKEMKEEFNSNTIELTMHTSCYCALRLTLCYFRPTGGPNLKSKKKLQKKFQKSVKLGQI